MSRLWARVSGVVTLSLWWALAVPLSAQAALTIDAAQSADQGSAVATVSTAAFSTSSANELLLAFVATDNLGTPNTTVTGVAGAGLTWVLVARTNVQQGSSEVWRAFAATPLSGVTVTATLSQKVASSITVVSFTGADTSGTNGSGAIGATASANSTTGAPTASVVTTRAESWVFGVGNDYDNAIARAVPAGQTLIHQYLTALGDTYWVQRQSAPTAISGTKVTINDTAPTTDRYNMTVVEVLPAAGVPALYSVSGAITPPASGSGATVTLTQGTTTVASTTADASGNYTFGSLPSGTYTVTPTRSGFTFSPASQTATVTSANVTGVNFTATAVPTYSVSGSIAPAASGSGSTVTLTQGTTTVATTTADASGNFTFSGIANGGYTVAPSKSGFAFSPSTQAVTVASANVAAVNFTISAASIYSVSGLITPAATGSGATVALTQGTTTIATTTTDASGNYTFANLANGSYTVAPTKTGYTFSPANRAVTIAGANVTAVNFTISAALIYGISGSITPAASGSGAIVALTQGTTTIATVTADGSGNYSFTSLAIGSYTVTPSKSGFAISPASQTVTIAGANVAGVNFSANAASTFSISGAITPAASGNGATVALLQGGSTVATTTADASGNYSFASLLNGSYTVTPGKLGYAFTPASQAVTVAGANVPAVNFTAQASSAGIAYIQGTTVGNVAVGPSIAATFTSPNTQGNLLIVTGTAARPAATLSISDTAGNAYGLAFPPVTDPVQNVTLYVWYVPYCKGGPNTVTLTPSAAGELEIHVAEFAGADPSSPIDQYSTATGTGTAISSGAKTTSTSGELVYGYSFIASSSSAVGAGFTGSSNANGDWDEYRIAPAPASVAATFTQAPSGTWLAAMVTVKPAYVPAVVSDWLTYGHDQMRSGNAAGEIAISPSTVKNLALKWSAPVDGKLTAQPLFAGSVQVAGQAHDLVVAVTSNNSVFGLDAATGAILWSRHFGAPSGAGSVPGGFGIGQTPAIDKVNGRIYTVTDDGILRTLALATGMDAAPALTVIPNNTATNSVYGGLNLVGAKLYIPTSSNGNDDHPWSGRLIQVDVSGAAPTISTTFKVVPSVPDPNGGGGIWGWGGITVDPLSGRVLAATAADGIDGSPSGQGFLPWSGRMLALDTSLNVLGAYEPPHPTPCPGDSGTCDMDFGSTPTLYQSPGCPVMASAVNKDGHMYTLSVNDLAANKTASLQAVQLNIAWDGPGRGGLTGLPAYWPLGNMLFVTDGLDPSLGLSIPGVNAGVVGLKVGPSCTAKVAWSVDWSGRSGGPALTAPDQPPSPATVAGGVVFVASGVDGSVHAFDPATGTELWNSGRSISGVTFVAPMVAEGVLYTASWDGFVPAAGGTVRAFALGGGQPPPPVALIGDQSVEGIIDSNPTGSAEAFQATATGTGTVTKVSLYLDASSTTNSVIVGLYSNSGSSPSQLLARGSSTTVQPGAWNTITVPPVAVTAGTPYWIAILSPSGNTGSFIFRDANGPCVSKQSSSSALTDLPATWTTGATWPSCPVSAYGTAQ
jgi:hypothetical protein